MQDINYHGMRLIKIKVHKETSDFFFCIVACLGWTWTVISLENELIAVALGEDKWYILRSFLAMDVPQGKADQLDCEQYSSPGLKTLNMNISTLLQ